MRHYRLERLFDNSSHFGDELTVEADRQTISAKDRQLLLDLVRHRPLQFCLFLSTLFGQKQMELMMLSAIKNTRAMAAQDPDA